MSIVRVVTASSLFDGHDASINIFRRLLQKEGCEVIHIGHNRSVQQIVTTAIQEDANAICISSYQGGHMEFFRYLYDLLKERGAGDVTIFGGGGGTILPSEIKDLQDYGITRLYHVEDGRRLGLRGVIKDALERINSVARSADFYEEALKAGKATTDLQLAKTITMAEQSTDFASRIPGEARGRTPIIGLTGPGGAGKSSLVDELVMRFQYSSPEGRVGILSFDPTKKATGGALLGDRIRMNSIYSGRVFLRSMATRGSATEVSAAVTNALKLMQQANFDLIILETIGIGQGDTAIVELSDLPVYVMTSEYGASTQLEKIDMLDFAECVAINKFERMGSLDAFEDVLHAYASARNERVTKENRNKFPIFGTIASHFNDPGVTRLYEHLINSLRKKDFELPHVDLSRVETLDGAKFFTIIPPERTFYLGEIADNVRDYKKTTQIQSEIASQVYRLQGAVDVGVEASVQLGAKKQELSGDSQKLIEEYQNLSKVYRQDTFEYQVRDKIHRRSLFTQSLSDLKIPKIALPSYRDWGDILTFMRLENFPGRFPYTAGVFSLKSDVEDPKRQFAGEGSPQRTNRRFHYLSRNDLAKRLSTAFDSVTLYGEDPAKQPDVYGKIGNSGVSIATLDDMKELYKGFNLVDALTSVSLTINGPAPMILAMFLNTAIDFEVARTSDPYEQTKKRVLETVRGTVQADILKEEQAQNTCIFSSLFALKMMGDIQEYFIQNKVNNFYSVSVSGYHIAEAGANPITQLAFTLANGFTYVEYYLSRGMAIDDFAPNLSFFFSSGLDPEYSVIGRVARRIWATTMRHKYGANDRSCRLKYHIQTSGRSLHAQEIAYNDVRTTLQALMAVYDNCNSLHTNAYDEAITTPTEESVRRAMAIQLIITKELGASKCDNPMQGSFFYQELTDLVEEAVLNEFDSISRRGGVLGAMEKQYQRHAIQTESMKWETLKSTGDLPIIGVNTFLSDTGQPDYEHIEVIRATEEEKQVQIERVARFVEKAGDENAKALERLRKVALSGGNIFGELMETVKYASLGQITHLLYQCGGEYRRSM
ncbi:MAG: methylmalonyl-CoA mutase family protein [Chlamydiales bacterium]|nr:methylmalonyl-CoA mutase family protein [Chlamydiales bacterium]